MRLIILLILLLVNLQAGKVIWDKNSNPTITGTDGKGCIKKSGFDIEDNATKDTEDTECQ